MVESATPAVLEQINRQIANGEPDFSCLAILIGRSLGDDDFPDGVAASSFVAHV